MSLTRYRNRVRVGRMMQRLEDGDRDFAGLAADLGFADQAHLTRTAREHAGETPTALRLLLAPAAGLQFKRSLQHPDAGGHDGLRDPGEPQAAGD